MSKVKRKRSSVIKDLHLDKPTSHGGWPGGHTGSYTDHKTPVNKQIARFIEDMGLADDPSWRRLSESKKRKRLLSEMSQKVREEVEDLSEDLEEEAADQGLIVPQKKSWWNVATAFLGTFIANPAKIIGIYPFTVGHGIEAALVIKGLKDSLGGYNALIDADHIIEKYIGRKPLTSMGAQPITQEELNMLAAASSAELVEIRKLIVLSAKLRVRGAISLLSGIPDELLGFASAPIVQGLAFQNVDKLWVETNKAMQGLLDAMPALIPIASRKDKLGIAFSFLIGGARVATAVPFVLGVKYNIGLLLRFLKVTSGSEQGALTVVPNMTQLPAPPRQNYTPPNQGGETVNIDPQDVKTVEIDDEGNVIDVNESKLRSLIREAALAIILEKTNPVAEKEFDYLNPADYGDKIASIGKRMGGERGEQAAKISTNIGVGIAKSQAKKQLGKLILQQIVKNTASFTKLTGKGVPLLGDVVAAIDAIVEAVIFVKKLKETTDLLLEHSGVELSGYGSMRGEYSILEASHEDLEKIAAILEEKVIIGELTEAQRVEIQKNYYEAMRAFKSFVVNLLFLAKWVGGPYAVAGAIALHLAPVEIATKEIWLHLGEKAADMTDLLQHSEYGIVRFLGKFSEFGYIVNSIIPLVGFLGDQRKIRAMARIDEVITGDFSKEYLADYATQSGAEHAQDMRGARHFAERISDIDMFNIGDAVDSAFSELADDPQFLSQIMPEQKVRQLIRTVLAERLLR